MCSLLIPRPQHHNQHGYHKVVEKYPNPYGLFFFSFFFLKTSLVAWHMVQDYRIFRALPLLLVIGPPSSFLPPLLADPRELG